MRNCIKKSIPFILLTYTILITTLSLVSLPQTSEIELPTFFDKIVHFCFYLGMSLLVLTIFLIRRKQIKTIDCIMTFMFTFGFGFIIELVQPYFGRTFGLEDIVANCCGNIVGIIILIIICRYTNYFKE